MPPSVERGPVVRTAVGVVVLLTVAGVLLAGTLGTFFIGYAAQAACTPDGGDRSCLRTTVLPWTNVGLQVLLLVAGLAWGTRLRRSADGGAAVLVTVAVGLAPLVVAAVVLGGLMVVADRG